MTLAAVDQLVHHAVIFEMNVENYRRRAAVARQAPRTGNDSERDSKTQQAITTQKA